MRILKLLQELYLELKTLNENFNENKEYFSLIEQEKRRNRENPVRCMTDIEKIQFKIWLKKRLEEKNITFDSASGYAASKVNEFIDVDRSKLTLCKDAQTMLTATLGYDNIEELFTAWRQSKGGAA